MRGLAAIGLRYKVYVRPIAEWRRIHPGTPRGVQWVLAAAFCEDMMADAFALQLQQHGWTVRYGEVRGPVDEWNQPVKKDNRRGRTPMPLPCGCSRGVRHEGGKQKKDVKYLGDGTLICKHGRYKRDGTRVPMEGA